MPVPPGFCVTTCAFDQFLNDGQNFPRLPQTWPPMLSEPELASLAETPIPRLVEHAILDMWREQGEELTYAVRSSATVEDAHGRSFAGQFETCLNICGQDALLGAIRKCWLSLFSARVSAYQSKGGLPTDRMAMAVIVQELIAAETAGVLFTVDPISGNPSHMIIEAAPGLGDRLVSGQVAPDRIVLLKPGLRVRPTATSVPACLNASLARRIGKLAMKAERLLGQPIDLEWAAAGNRVFLLQARPATTHPAPKSWEDRQVWSNVNAGEVLPDVMTPMTWSVIQRLLGPLFGSLFRLFGADADRAPVAGLVAGRVYLNVNTGLAAARPFWFLLRGINNFAESLGGGFASEDYRELLEIPDTDLPDVGFRWHNYILSVPRILCDLIRHSPRRADVWTTRLRSLTAQVVRVDLDPMSTPDLIAWFERILALQFEAWDLLYLGTQAAVLPLFQKACRDWLDDPCLTIGYRLFAGLGDIPEADAGLALWRLAMLSQDDKFTESVLRSSEGWSQVQSRLRNTEPGRHFLEAWAAFMSEHGHRCRGELELYNARWSETPDYILGVVRGYLDSSPRSNPIEKQQRLTGERLRLTDECRRRLPNPIKRRLFSAALGRAQKLAVAREVWKDQAVQMIVVLRRILLMLGERLCRQGIIAHSDDIFFLEAAELPLAANVQSDFNTSERIRTRRLEYAANLQCSPPPVVAGKFQPGITDARVPTRDAAAKCFAGIPVSPGTATGRVRVILRTDDHEQIRLGEILVAPFTDPAWTPYFVNAAGVIMEQGGILSHGSIVAREFGLPAVTNLRGATTRLHTGDLVHLDGNLGRVTLLNPKKLRGTDCRPKPD